MAMAPEAAEHAAYVEAWLARVAPGADHVPPATLIDLLDRAMGALWRRADATLGQVTLTAIVDRVLYTSSERYPFLSTLKIVEAGVSFDALRRQGGASPDNLPEVVRWVLVEFLTVIGNLTDEILTPPLHAELARIALEEPETAGDDEGDEGVRS
jgi:hypothetical protein